MTSVLSCSPDAIHVFTVISEGLLRNVGVNVAFFFVINEARR